MVIVLGIDVISALHHVVAMARRLVCPGHQLRVDVGVGGDGEQRILITVERDQRPLDVPGVRHFLDAGQDGSL